MLAFMKKFTLLLAIVLSTGLGFAQFSTGTWRDHLPYQNAIDICIDRNDLVWVATPYALFTYNFADGDLQRVSKVNRLSDVGITALEYDSFNQAIIVGYSNGNVDVLFESGEVNIPAIKISALTGDKAIYNIEVVNDAVYLSTGFGIVVLDVARREVSSTYFLGIGGQQVKVNDVEVFNSTIYAATAEGLRKADRNDPFLANFENWELETSIPVGETIALETYAGNLVALVKSDTDTKALRLDEGANQWIDILPGQNFPFQGLWANEEWLVVTGDGAYFVFHFDFVVNNIGAFINGIYVNIRNGLVDKFGNIWLADRFNGLLGLTLQGEELVIRPKGPAQAAVRKLTAYNDNLWIAHGGFDDSWSNNWNQSPMSGFVNETWTLVNPGAGVNGTPGVSDFMDAAVDPLDNNHIFFASWEEGLVEIDNGTIRYYNPTVGNTTLLGSGFPWVPGWTGVANVHYDINGNLWCSNSFTDKQLHVLDTDKQFHAFSFSPTLSDVGRVGEVLATQEGYVFMTVPNEGILAFDYNGTITNTTDDNFKILNDVEGRGGLPNKDVFCMEEDVDGELWIGTLQGIAVFYNQQAIFEEEGFDAEQILIEQDGNLQFLLETEAVTAIRIDGGNRKWVGTQNSGVFLFSDDGLEEVFHFTSENSPLLSNNIYDIAVNQENGEVFFATDQGIVSFFSTATNFDNEMNQVRAYPNPVRPEYEGNVTVDGLAFDTTVKITDLQGNLVFETQSQGGRAVWNGKLLSGERPATGVYLVFAATPDGDVSNVGKITIIR